jgi:hypothetical protein
MRVAAAAAACRPAVCCGSSYLEISPSILSPLTETVSGARPRMLLLLLALLVLYLELLLRLLMLLRHCCCF